MIKNISTFFPLNKPYIKLLSFVLLLSVWAISAQSAFANEGNGKGVLVQKEQNLDASQWCICPPSWINVSCSQLDPGLNYGNPTIAYGCNCGSIIYGPYIQDNRVGCGSGTIIKTWNIWTVYGDYTCVQTINVTGGYNGYPVIQWPPDYTVTGCGAATDPELLPPPYNNHQSYTGLWIIIPQKLLPVRPYLLHPQSSLHPQETPEFPDILRSGNLHPPG